MMQSLAVLLPLAAFSMGQFVSPPILTLGQPSDAAMCASVVINWDWTGSNKAATVAITNQVTENEISTSNPFPPAALTDVVGVNIDLMRKTFVWEQAAVIGGWYAFKIYDDPVGGSVSVQSKSFFVSGVGTPTCNLVVETGTVGRGPTSDGLPTATASTGPVPTQVGTTPEDGNSDSQSGGGINAGVIAGIVLGALAGIAIAGVLFFFLCRRRGRGFIRASRAFGKLDAEAKGSTGKSGHGRWGGLGSVDITTAANQQAKASPAGSDETADKDFPFTSSTANGGSTAAQSRITLGDEKTDNDDENPFKEPVIPSLQSQPSGTLVQEESRVASPVSRTTSPRPAPPPPPARRGSILSSSSSSQDHNAPPSSPPLTAQRRVSVKGPPPPITPRANRSNTGPKTPTLSPRSRTASLKEFVDQNQGYAMAAYSLNNASGQDEQARYSRHSNMPALAHAVPTAIITTPPRPPSTIGMPLTQPRRKPAPVYDIEMKSKSESDGSASALGLSIGTNGGTNASSATLGNGNGVAALGSGTGIGLAADGDGPVHYLIPDLPPPQPRGR